MQAPAARRILARRASQEVTGVLCEAFADYPVMRYVLGPDGDYPGRLRTLVGFFVAARAIPEHPVLGVSIGPELAGVALCTPPKPPAPLPELDTAREETWGLLGADARARYDECGRAWETVAVAEPNLHLNMIGVPPRFRGRGLARLLLDAVQALSRDLPGSRGVSLTTESAANVELYRHFGYRLVGQRRIAPELETWGFFRPD